MHRSSCSLEEQGRAPVVAEIVLARRAGCAWLWRRCMSKRLKCIGPNGRAAGVAAFVAVGVFRACVSASMRQAAAGVGTTNAEGDAFGR